MRRIQRIIDTIKDISEIVLAAPVALATGGGVIQVVGKSIANPKVSGAIYNAGKLVTQGGIKLAKIYGKAGKIGLQALGKGVVKSTPALKAVAKTLPCSRFVPTALKVSSYLIPAYLSVAGAVKAVKQYNQIKQVKSSPMGKLSSERPTLTFKSVFELLKDAALFR